MLKLLFNTEAKNDRDLKFNQKDYFKDFKFNNLKDSKSKYEPINMENFGNYFWPNHYSCSSQNN